jgi:hypothetical protein
MNAGRKNAFLILLVKFVNLLKYYKDSVNMIMIHILIGYDEKGIKILLLSLTKERGFFHDF